YAVSAETIRLFSTQIRIVEDSLIIGFRIELTPESPLFFGKAKSFNDNERFFRNMDDHSSSDNLKIPFMFKPIDKIIVRNIGQGSWNELVSNNKIILAFDFGTSYTTKKNDVRKLIGNREVEYQISYPILILSHWDVDHYHFLLAFSDVTIKSIFIFVYRSAIPNLTSRKALGRFRILNKNALLAIPCYSPNTIPSFPQKFYFPGISSIIIYNANKSRSKNKSGIALVVRRKKICFIFPGDYDYTQISKYILPDLNYACQHYLNVPHHGGKAGNFIYDISGKNIPINAVISVGKNPYGHPNQKNIMELKKKGFRVVRTDVMHGDYSINI
ncbi:MAG TPA: hypothetical protein VKR58_09540, partial [Aquella sp.]|nr:hypothetical protein [Aquella sp.]